MDGLGELLKSERLRTKISVAEISKRTNIKEKIINALEENDYSNIHGKFYLKNFIKNYLMAIDIDYNDFFSKHKTLINNIKFDGDNSGKNPEYIYQMRYSKFKKKGFFVRLMISILIMFSVYFVYKNFDRIISVLNVEEIETIKNIPETNIGLPEVKGIMSYRYKKTDENDTDESFGYCEDRWAVDLVIIVNKRTWITVFKAGKKIIGKNYNAGDVIKLKGYKFFLHVQFASAVDVLLNGEELKYFKDKNGYQKLLITNMGFE